MGRGSRTAIILTVSGRRQRHVKFWRLSFLLQSTVRVDSVLVTAQEARWRRVSRSLGAPTEGFDSDRCGEGTRLLNVEGVGKANPCTAVCYSLLQSGLHWNTRVDT